MSYKIIAIGGGGFGQNKNNKSDTQRSKMAIIEDEILIQTNKPNPTLLFIPTASSDDESYCASLTSHFQSLGCKTDILKLINQKINSNEIQAKINQADIIYVGGGNTLKMMNLWRRLGIDQMLRAAAKQGKVLCGVSAGSICWFDHGNSDSRKSINPKADYIRVSGLGLIPALNCPHYDSESDRKESLKRMLKKYGQVGIALEDYTALQIQGDQCRILRAQPNAEAYLVYFKDRKFNEIRLDNNWRLLKDLLNWAT